ncbi:MAG: hypothetical protein WCW84_13100 [Sulfurimonas sp.]|jgi:hypothetical protein
MNKTIQEYFDALQRLIDNKPINVPKGSKINNDTVALEAGRKRGTIKKSREVFIELIEAIEAAGKEENDPREQYEATIEKYKASAKKYRGFYEQALNRELMLIERVNELEKQLKQKSRAANNVT